MCNTLIAVLEMKILIYWSESNSRIYLYIFLNKNWKIYWSKQRLLVLGRKTGAHYEDCNRKCHWIKDQGYFSCHMVCKSLPSDTNMANGYPCTKRSIFRIKPCYAATIGSDKFLSWKNLAVGLRAFNIFLVYQYFTIYTQYFLLNLNNFHKYLMQHSFKIRRYQWPF
jgi:hypothetical protein